MKYLKAISMLFCMVYVFASCRYVASEKVNATYSIRHVSSVDSYGAELWANHQKIWPSYGGGVAYSISSSPYFNWSSHIFVKENNMLIFTGGVVGKDRLYYHVFVSKNGGPVYDLTEDMRRWVVMQGDAAETSEPIDFGAMKLENNMFLVLISGERWGTVKNDMTSVPWEKMLVFIENSYKRPPAPIGAFK